MLWRRRFARSDSTAAGSSRARRGRSRSARGACAGRGDAVTAETFDLNEVGGVLPRPHRVGRAWTELGAVSQHEGGDVAPAGREGERGAGCEAVLARVRALGVVGDDQGSVRAVRGAQGEDGRGGGLSDLDPARLGSTVRNRAERRGVVRFDARDACGAACRREGCRRRVEQCDQDVACGRGDGGVGRRPSTRSPAECVGTRAAVDRVQGIVDGDMRHCIKTRFVERVVVGRHAGSDRGLTGVRVPGGDRIGSDLGVGVRGSCEWGQHARGGRRGGSTSKAANETEQSEASNGTDAHETQHRTPFSGDSGS